MKPSNDKEAIGLIVDGLLAAGVRLTIVNNGEEEIVVHTREDAVTAVTAVDEAALIVRLPDGSRGWVWFVLGNEPEEVAADYTVNLEDFLRPIVHPWWE